MTSEVLLKDQGVNIECLRKQEALVTPETNDHDSKSRVVLNALSMALGTMTSRVLGLVREMLLTAYFPRSITDAWTVAFRLPNVFRRILGEGSLSVSFIPVFVEARQDSPERAKNVMNGVYTLLLLVLTLLTALGIVYTEALVNVMLDETYASIPGKLELTCRMARIMFGFIFMISTYAFYMGVLNALGAFAIAAMAPTLFNVSMIISTVIPSDKFSSPGDGLAWGVLIGGALQMLLLVPVLRSKDYFPRIRWDLAKVWQNPDVRKVFRNMLPGLFGLGLLQITTLVNQRFASELGEGAITYIYLADRLLELPLSLISVSLGVALLPTLSGLWSQGKKEAMSDTMAFYLRLNLYMVSAAAVGLFMLSRPVVEVLFQRGKFVAHDVEATVGVVCVWSLIMIPSSLVRVLAPSYYAVKNTWFPAVVSLVCLVVHLLVAPRLMHAYGLTGLNTSSLVSSTLNMVLLLSFYGRLIHPMPLGAVFKKVALFVIPLVGMGLVLMFYPVVEEWVLSRFDGFVFIAKILLLTVFISLGAGAFISISWVMGLDESKATVNRLLGKLARKFKKS